MLEKAPTLVADEVVLDLEDSVPPQSKHEARAAVAAAVRSGDWAGRTVAVRINGPDTHHCYRDVTEIVEGAGESLSCLVVPKVECAADLEFVDRLVTMVEQDAGRSRPVGLEALIETAAGLRRIDEIAHASGRLEALIVGYADLGASLGRPRSAHRPQDWQWVLDTVLVAARSAGLQAIDGPHLQIEDLDGLRAAALHARALGYDGKWAVHPGQIDPLNEIFAPSQEEFARASAILDTLARAEAAGRGVLVVDGEMIDEAHRKLAALIVSRGKAAGLGPPAPQRK